MPTLVNRGKQIIADRLRGVGTEPNFVAWGTGTTAEAATQAALTTEGPEARVAGSSSTVTTTTTSDSYQVVATITASAARAVTEAGLFDASTAGNMLLRGLFAAVNLAAGDSIQFTVKVQFT